MKKGLFILLAMFLGSYIAFSQVVPGTAESAGWGGERSVTANGLSQIYSATGKYFLSADGAGSQYGAYTVDINKPSASATVTKAILMAASTGYSGYSLPNGFIALNGNPITWTASISSGISSYNHYADITGLVAAIMNPAGVGVTTLPVTETNYSYNDGIALLVIFSDPLSPNETIVIMWGALSTTGDNFSLTLGTPINPADPGALFDMGVGISFGYQIGGGIQRSLIDINSVRLTSSAGGQDDGTTNNGGLITVGGLGDLNTNPADPNALPVNQFSDDELYSLLPFITNTTTNILVNTLNPSNDDNIFLAYFEISGAAIIGEGILLTQEEDVNPVGTNHTVTALVQNNLGAPIPGMTVEFIVISGPNAGTNGSAVTNADGIATYTYNGAGGPGIDEIEACFNNSQQVWLCSNILEKTWEGEVPPIPVSNWALIIGIMMILVFTVIRFRK